MRTAEIKVRINIQTIVKTLIVSTMIAVTLYNIFAYGVPQS